MENEITTTDGQTMPYAEFRAMCKEHIRGLNGMIEKRNNARAERSIAQWQAAIDQLILWFKKNNVEIEQVGCTDHWQLTPDDEERRKIENMQIELTFHSIQRRIEYAQDQLKVRTESLVWSLERDIERMNKGDWKGLNTCGLVQGAGASIDILVAEIAALQRALEEFGRVVTYEPTLYK